MFISDHGFQSVTRTIHMDHLLKRLGFLEISASNMVFGPMQWGPVRKIAPKAVRRARPARQGEPAAVGERVQDQGLHDDPLAGREPDGIVDPADFEKVLTHAKTALEDADWISGDHRIEGVIVAAGLGVKPFEQPPLLIDLAPTILAALNAPSSVEHTGRVLHEVVGTDAGVAKKEPTAAIPGMSDSDDPSSVTDTEADEMEEHLRGLGYLE